MTPPPQPEYIITEEQLSEFEHNAPMPLTLGNSVCSRPYQSSRDKVLVYSWMIKLLVNFPCITRRELALKDFENDDTGQSWTSLNFNLEIGDEIRVYRKVDTHQTKAGEQG